MARFVTNIERFQCIAAYKKERKLLCNDRLTDVDTTTIEESCTRTLNTLKDLLGHNTIYMER